MSLHDKIRSECFEGVPTECDPNDKDYAYAVCRCEVPLNMAIKIPISWDHNDGFYHFKCKKCGTCGVLAARRETE